MDRADVGLLGQPRCRLRTSRRRHVFDFSVHQFARPVTVGAFAKTSSESYSDSAERIVDDVLPAVRTAPGYVGGRAEQVDIGPVGCLTLQAPIGDQQCDVAADDNATYF